MNARSGRRRRERKNSSRRGGPLAALDLVQGALILLLIAAAPWLFGCTEWWSVTVMNCGAFLTGVCGIIAFFTRRHSEDQPEKKSDPFARWFLASNIIVLLYCLVALLNARASFSFATETFTYREGVLSWLPTTYDRNRTFQFFVNSLGLFSFFWSLRHWLGARENEHGYEGRMKTLLWVFVVNGFLVALQAIFQRLSDSPKLLWFRPSFWNTPESCFGPFSYRGNAADYLNLVWPVTFGFWHFLSHRKDRRRPGIGDGPELLLLPFCLVTALASFVSLSRGGALVAAAMLVLICAVLLAGRGSKALKISVAATVGVLVIASALVAGSSLAERFRKAYKDNMSGRTEIYKNAQQMSADFPWFGSGPGSFLSTYQLYRENADQAWAAFLHDDWLETRVTFGRVGTAFVLLQLVLLVFWTFRGRGRWLSPILTFSLFLSAAGCLAHAKRDFPFQTYGVFFTFLVVCAVLPPVQTPISRNSEQLEPSES